jgi:hypothetical protein
MRSLPLCRSAEPRAGAAAAASPLGALAGALGLAAAVAAVAAVASSASAQTIDTSRPRTLVVGTPSAGAPADRVDAARTGRSRERLPAGSLRREWQVAVGATVERAPLVDVHGTTYVVGTRGEVEAIGRDGAERWKLATEAMEPGPAALLSDGTLVFVDAAGEAVGVRDGAERWRTRVGRPDAALPAPLPLDDGGVVVATTRELAALDADGQERARTTLPEATTVPLVSALGRVVAVTTSGAVWTWTPGAPEPTRVASFGSAVDGGAALADDHTLVAVTAGQLHLAAVDLVRGTTTTRAVAPGLWLGPPAMRGGTAYLLALTPTGELAVALDASGAETARALLAPHPPPATLDGGLALLPSGPHTPPLVDDAGTVAFATLEGGVGVVAAGVPGATAERLPDACPLSAARPSVPAGRAGPAAPVAGLAPLGAGAFVAVCRSGMVLALGGGRA